MNHIKKIILGTVQFGLDYGINNLTGKTSINEVKDILDYARSVGVDTLDTAAGYGDAEERIGDYHISNPPFHIITKFDKVSGIGWEESIQISLAKLRVPIAETVMFHSFRSYDQSKFDLPDIIAKGKGKYFNHLGVSVYTNQELEELIHEENIQIVQLPFNLLDNESLRGNILRRLKEKGKMIYVRSVFLQGLFYKDPERLPDNLIPLKPYLHEIHHIADKEYVDISVLALQYVHSRTYIDGIIIGVDNKIQLEKNIQALGQSLDLGIFERINAIKVNQSELLNPSKW